jgi:lactate dehydrogenase-like 2-hydroxyacid dehydrogenase
VTLHLPAGGENDGLVAGRLLGMMKPTAYFINAARGSLVDEDALADALEAGIVSAAALDVHASEPTVNARLVRMATQVDAGNAVPGPGRVMLTCHNAGGTVETHVGFEELSMRNILAVLRGGEAVTAVNLGDLRR